MDLTPCEFTPAMEEVMARRSERQALGKEWMLKPRNLLHGRVAKSYDGVFNLSTLSIVSISMNLIYL